MNYQLLERFIVRAKKQTYVGSGERADPSRLGSHDLIYEEGEFTYRDSYFGGIDFIGQEVVWFQGEPVWAMNYYGYILEPELIRGDEAGAMIKESLTLMYEEGRFLGGFQHRKEQDEYVDTSVGDVRSFNGREWIIRQEKRVYELVYHGGLIK